MRLQFFGAAGEVTGSCTLIDTGKSRILVDCGMFQGRSDAYNKNMADFPFEPSSIDAVLITHAHIDHIGRIPKLVKQGFAGKIFTTLPTEHIAPLMWEDAARVMQQGYDERKKEPMYTVKDVPAATELLSGVAYDKRVRITDDCSCVFREAGHILGSSFIEVEAAGNNLVFSGDLGNDHTPILRDTTSITKGDTIILESTYGNRTHDDPRKRPTLLAGAIHDIIDRKGTLLIPAFSLERAQEILYELNEMVESRTIPALPTYLDSPLAQRALGIYKHFSEFYDKEAAALRKHGDDFFKFPNLTIIEDVEESAKIAEVRPPKIVIAGSGMMHGGRVMGHLKRYVSDSRNIVLVVGYQSQGTVGRNLKDGAAKITIDHEEIEVHAEVRVLGSYSAHADSEKLLKWVVSGPVPPQAIYLNHGDPDSAKALAARIRMEYDIDVHIPKLGDAFTINPT